MKVKDYITALIFCVALFITTCDYEEERDCNKIGSRGLLYYNMVCSDPGYLAEQGYVDYDDCMEHNASNVFVTWDDCKSRD
jgi:hypothetical protein